MSLIHWWPLTTDLKDKCGGSDMKCSVASFVTGKVGNCIQIAGGDAQVSNPFIGMENWSIAFWFRDDGSSDWKDFICWSDNKARLEIYKTGGQWIWYSNSTTSGSLFPSGTTINSAIQTNVWYHITIVKEGTKAYLYMNGNVDSPTTSTSAVTFTSASAILHFNSRADTSYGAMSLNDVRCYDHALSKKEVQELSRGLVCHYKLNANNNTNLLINSATPSFTGYTAQSSGTIVTDSLLNKKVYECSNTATTEKYIFYSNRFPLIGGETYTFSCDIYCNTYLKGIDVYLLSSSTIDASTVSTSYSSDGVKYFAKTPSTGLVPGQWVHISGTLTPNSNQISGYIRIDNNGSSSSGTAAVLRVINCKLERGSKESTSGISLGEAGYNSVEVDSSGYNNHGTKYGTLTYSSDSILNGSCTIFPGTAGNYINCGSGGKVKDAITVNWWGYMDSWTSYGRAISCTEGGGWNFEPSGGKMNFACGTGASSNTYKSVVSTTTLASLPAGWHMFTGTYDGFKTKIYIDGKLENTNNAYSTKTPLYYANNSIFLGIEAQGGANNPTSPYFNGRLSDVRIYATALSDAAIQELYTIRWSANKQGQVFSGTVNENQSKFQITRSGIVNCNVMNESGNIPSDYIPLQYLQSSGTQFINTNHLATQNTRTIFDYEYLNASASWAGLFGSDNHPTNNNMGYGLFLNGTVYSCYVSSHSGSSGCWNQQVGTWTQNQRTVLNFTHNKLIVDNVAYNLTTTTFTTSLVPMYLFSFRRSTGNAGVSSIRLYGCQILEGSTLVRNFIPAKRANDSVLGLYDTVNGIFYTNAGSGSFVAGPAAVGQGRNGNFYVGEFNEI